MTDNPYSRPDPTPSDQLRWDVDRAILAHVRAAHGDQAVTRKPTSPTWKSTHVQPVDYRHGIEAARLAAAFARREMLRFAAKARGEGTPWSGLAQPLGLSTEPDWRGRPAEQAAFELVAGYDERSYATPSVGWDCVSCGAWVTDRGPYNGCPADDETGHAGDCRRHRAEIAAWETQYGDD
jgi:hypothetical protein